MKDCQPKCQIICESLEADLEKETQRIRQEIEEIKTKIQQLTEQNKLDKSPSAILENPKVIQLMRYWQYYYLPILNKKNS